MHIKRLCENLVQKTLLLFEILSFEVYCRSDSDSPIWDMGVGDFLILGANQIVLLLFR